MSIKDLQNQSFAELIFNPMLYAEYPYQWTDEKENIIFSKKPRYNWGILEIIELKEKIKNVNIPKNDYLERSGK